jgi:transcriptional regulator with XRE-family HTH domain
MRDDEGWSQQQLAEKVGTNQNAISRLENPFYGKPTITTLKRIAAAFDVALVLRFVPFSQLIAWVSGTPFVDNGLSSKSLAVPNFSNETRAVTLASIPPDVNVIPYVHTYTPQLGSIQKDVGPTVLKAIGEIAKQQPAA